MKITVRKVVVAILLILGVTAAYIWATTPSSYAACKRKCQIVHHNKKKYRVDHLQIHPHTVKMSGSSSSSSRPCKEIEVPGLGGNIAIDDIIKVDARWHWCLGRKPRRVSDIKLLGTDGSTLPLSFWSYQGVSGTDGYRRWTYDAGAPRGKRWTEYAVRKLTFHFSRSIFWFHQDIYPYIECNLYGRDLHYTCEKGV